MTTKQLFYSSRTYILFGLFFTLLLACSKDDEPVRDSTGENVGELEVEEGSKALDRIVITSNTDTLAANGVDKVLLEVEVFDIEENLLKDPDYTLLLNGEVLNAHYFTAEEEGVYKVIARIEEIVSDEIKIEGVHPNLLVKSLHLEATTQLILADGLSFSTLEVQALGGDGKNIQGAEYTLFANEQTLEDNRFRSSQVGEHQLYAGLEELQSNKIMIKAREKIEYEEISIPVIFHIVHFGEQKGSGNNLPAQAVQEQLSRLNKGFSNNYGSGNPNSVDTHIRFRLAQFDENNNTLSEHGIHRIDGTPYDNGSTGEKRKQDRPWPIDENLSTSWITTAVAESEGDIANDEHLGVDEAYELGGATMWDMEQYLNIYIFPFQPDQGMAGYAYLPIVWDSHPLEGVADYPLQYKENLDYQFEQNALNTQYIQQSSSTTIVHEVGHNLGLLHTFSTDNCESSDYCSDTYSYIKDLPAMACDDNQGILDSDNFMDYIGSRNTFTYEQRERMRHVLNYGFYYSELKHSNK